MVANSGGAGVVGTASSNVAVTALAWAVVGIPLFFGIWVTLQKAFLLFK